MINWCWRQIERGITKSNIDPAFTSPAYPRSGYACYYLNSPARLLIRLFTNNHLDGLWIEFYNSNDALACDSKKYRESGGGFYYDA